MILVIEDSQILYATCCGSDNSNIVKVLASCIQLFMLKHFIIIEDEGTCES
jgi:hypothetical protein